MASLSVRGQTRTRSHALQGTLRSCSQNRPLSTGQLGDRGGVKQKDQLYGSVRHRRPRQGSPSKRGPPLRGDSQGSSRLSCKPGLLMRMWEPAFCSLQRSLQSHHGRSQGVRGRCLVVCGGMAPCPSLCSEDSSPRKGCGGGFQRKKNPTCHRPPRRREPRGTEAVQQGRDLVCKAGST